MKLKEFFPNLELEERLANLEIKNISRDSCNLEKGDMFFVIEGVSFNIFSILNQIKNKVAVFVGDKKKKEVITSILKDAPVIYVDDPYREFRKAVDKLYSHSLKGLTFIGVTGTNGKTTTAFVIYELLKMLKKSVSLVGTVGYYIEDRKIEATYTTPDYLSLRKLLSLIKKRNSYVVMEVSSHALQQKRVEGIEFSQCIFTNLSREHLDYHSTMQSYFEAKKRLFLENPKATALVNIDNYYGRKLASQIDNYLVTYGFKKEAHFRAYDLNLSKEGSRFTLLHQEKKYPISIKLLGKHNILNILAGFASLVELGFNPDTVAKFLPQLNSPLGRLQLIGDDIYVDYAHTPQALKTALATLKEIGYQKVVCVFGCGGDRDKGKRAVMGEIASCLADFTILTSDNPRNEDPYQIISQIEKGFKRDNYTVVLDRRKAIKIALEIRKRQICAVLIAGKGHENYQIIKDRRIPFCDASVVRGLLRNE